MAEKGEVKRIMVRVIPRSSRAGVESMGDALRVHLKSPPVEGKANKELISVLAEYFKVRKSALSIVKGATSRDKLVEVDENG